MVFWCKLLMVGIFYILGRMTAAYGKQRQSHGFTKANKVGTCRHVENLATMAVHGAWQPSRTYSDADKKAFKRLQAELQAILPLPGDPFRKEGAQFYPHFDLSLPKEYWRDSNEHNELGSEEDWRRSFRTGANSEGQRAHPPSNPSSIPKVLGWRAVAVLLPWRVPKATMSRG
jgi:hypothetical protein